MPSDRTTSNPRLLAIPIVLHAVAIVATVVDVPSLQYLWPAAAASFILFPVYMTLVAVWLAMRPYFLRSLPWAVIATALAVAWYLHAPSLGNEETICLSLLMPLGAAGICGITRKMFCTPAGQGKSQLGLKQMLLWVTAIALVLAVVRGAPYSITYVSRTVRTLGGGSLMFYVLIVVEYCVSAQLLVIMVLGRKFLRWVIPFALLWFPAVMMLESWLVMQIMGPPLLLDPEGWLDAALQAVVLAATLLIWAQ